MFVVGMTANPEIQSTLKALQSRGITVLVHTTDSLDVYKRQSHSLFAVFIIPAMPVYAPPVISTKPSRLLPGKHTAKNSPEKSSGT